MFSETRSNAKSSTYTFLVFSFFALVKAKELLQPLLGTTINIFSCVSYVQCFLWDLLTYVKTRISPTASELFMLWYPENGEIVLASISQLSTLKWKKKENTRK